MPVNYCIVPANRTADRGVDMLMQMERLAATCLIGLCVSVAGAQEPTATANAEADVTQAAEVKTQPASTQPATTQPAATQPAATQPAATQPTATQPAPATITSEVLANRVRDLIREPKPTAGRAEVQRQLVDLTDNASRWYYNTDDAETRLTALSVQMQALYTQLVEDPPADQVDRLLSRLRAAARRAKSLDQTDADAIGDFWLMTADLLDLNRMDIRPSSHQAQAAELMSDYIADHPDAGPTAEVKAALAELNKARGIVEVEPLELEQIVEEQTPATQPAATQPAATQPAR